MLLVALLSTGLAHPALAQSPTREEALGALKQAGTFLRGQASTGGGYVWRYSGDLKLSEGEGKTTGTSLVWVQPPGTPTVGMAFLEAYAATRDEYYLSAARDAANVLVQGQLHTGGWYYHIELDPAERQAYLYRDLPVDRGVERANRTTVLDDDTTAAALRFLMRLDRALDSGDPRLHEAVEFSLRAVLAAQYPNGAWGHNWREYPTPRSPDEFPVIPASYPESWSRTWPNDWTGRYYLNDNITMVTAATLLEAFDAYGDERYLQSGLRAADFLLLAQMPDPQPAWAQQYDPAMRPVWDRKFEPPAVSGRESQDALLSLMLAYRRTGLAKYLAPIPRALAYLRASQLPDGSLARFYELQTNRPLYFTADYDLAYDPADAPSHYAFIVESRLDEVEAEYQRLLTTPPTDLWPPPPEPPPSRDEVRRIIDALDDRGAWVEEGVMDAHDVMPDSGVISSATFARNVTRLAAFIAPNQTVEKTVSE